MSIATQQIRREDARVQERLLKLLEQEPDWLFTVRLDTGIRWLDTHYGTTAWADHLGAGLPTLRGRLAASALFWGWWNNHWSNRDHHLEARLRPEQLNNGEWVLALYEDPAAPLADKLFYADRMAEFREFYAARHKALAGVLCFDPDLTRRIVRTAKLEESAIAAS